MDKNRNLLDLYFTTKHLYQIFIDVFAKNRT